VEIRAVLKAARESCSGRIIAVHQPHRYTRLSSLFQEFATCFNDADSVMLAPVYAAGEDPIEGVDSEVLVGKIRAAGHRDARYISGPGELAPIVAGLRSRVISWFFWGLVVSRNGRQRCPGNWKAYRDSRNEAGAW
jgi:UDP-N-acetylmuramate--alanine ligase